MKKQDIDIAAHVVECRNLKEKYRPTTPFAFLIIGESPPTSGQYFYKVIDLKASPPRIPVQVFRAFYKVDGINKALYEKYLVDLRDNKSFYLDDLSEIPLNDYTPPQRVAAISQGFTEFKGRIHKLCLASNCKKVLVLPKNTMNEFKKGVSLKIWNSIIEAIGISENEVCIFSDLESFIKTNWCLA